MSRTSALGQWTGLPVLADAADITQVGTTMADNIEKQINLRFASTAARDAAITSPVRGMIAYIDADNTRYIYTGSAWTMLQGPAHGTWTTYTPTLTQSTVVTKTVVYAAYMRLGRLIIGNVTLTATGAGTAANAVAVGLPVTAASASGTVGAGRLVDTSASTQYSGSVVPLTTTTVGIVGGGGVANVLGVAQFTAALANTDSIEITFHYEAAAD